MPNFAIPPSQIPKILKKRKRAADVARSELSIEDLEAETFADKCCFFLDEEKLKEKDQLIDRPNEFVQRILDKIFLKGKCCAKHVDAMVTTLLNSTVTEFNFLSLWEYEKRRGFENFQELCQQCPNLEKLRTLTKYGWTGNLYPKFRSMIDDVIQLKNLKELALYGYTCFLKDLWAIQKNLTNLEHLEVVLAKVEMEIVDPFLEMPKLKRLHLHRSDTYEDRINETEYVEILVECAGRIKGLQTLFFVCEEGKLFVENYAARFPQKPLHVDRIEFDANYLSIPWPTFLTCDRIQIMKVEKNLIVENFASINFPVKEFVFGQSLDTYLHPLLDIFGQNVELLRIMNVMSRPSKYGKITIILDEVVLKCPNLQNLMVEDWDFSYSLEDEPMEDDSPTKLELFSKIKKLTVGDFVHGILDDDETIEFYRDFFLMAKNIVYFCIDYVALSHAALKAMDADRHCFEKVEELYVSTFFDDDIDDSVLVFKLAGKMIFRCPRLKKITVGAQSYSSIQRYRYHWKSVRKLADQLKSTCIEFGIKVIYKEHDSQ